MGKVIQPDQFSKTVQDIIKMYGDNVASVTFDIVEKTAKDGRNKLRTTNWGWIDRGGGYHRSFKVKFIKRRLYSEAVIYSEKPHYRLTHLLEKGHKTVKGTGQTVKPNAKDKTTAYPHWAEVEKWAIDEIEERLLRGLIERGLA